MAQQELNTEASGRSVDTYRVTDLDEDFSREVGDVEGSNPLACFACGTCSGSCPTAFAMDYTPREVMRFIQLGMKEKALSCNTLWLCASCYTCEVRCPRGINLPEIMRALKRIAISEYRLMMHMLREIEVEKAFEEGRPIAFPGLDPKFKFEIADTPAAETILRCFQCGACTASCPMADLMDLKPHQVLKMTLLGIRDEALSSDAAWLCATCFICDERCPQGVKPKEIMDALKRKLIKEGEKMIKSKERYALYKTHVKDREPDFYATSKFRATGRFEPFRYIESRDDSLKSQGDAPKDD